MIVAAIDLSLTSTGVAVIHSSERIIAHTVKSAPPKVETLASRHARLAMISEVIIKLVGEADVVAIEAPIYAASARSGKVHDRAGLWWIVVSALYAAGKDVIEVAPSSRCTYATGVGNADKDRVLTCALKTYRQAEIAGNDQADAVVIAAMISRLLGQPVEPDAMPESKLRALASIRMPALAAA